MSKFYIVTFDEVFPKSQTYVFTNEKAAQNFAKSHHASYGCFTVDLTGEAEKRAIATMQKHYNEPTMEKVREKEMAIYVMPYERSGITKQTPQLPNSPSSDVPLHQVTRVDVHFEETLLNPALDMAVAPSRKEKTIDDAVSAGRVPNYRAFLKVRDDRQHSTRMMEATLRRSGIEFDKLTREQQEALRFAFAKDGIRTADALHVEKVVFSKTAQMLARYGTMTEVEKLREMETKFRDYFEYLDPGSEDLDPDIGDVRKKTQKIVSQAQKEIQDLLDKNLVSQAQFDAYSKFLDELTKNDDPLLENATRASLAMTATLSYMAANTPPTNTIQGHQVSLYTQTQLYLWGIATEAVAEYDRVNKAMHAQDVITGMNSDAVKQISPYVPENIRKMQDARNVDSDRDGRDDEWDPNPYMADNWDEMNESQGLVYPELEDDEVIPV